MGMVPSRKKLLHHFVIAFSDHFDELFVGFLGFIGKSGGDFFGRRFSVTIGMVDVRFHGHQINDAAESFFAADGQLESDDIAAENLIERSHGTFEAGDARGPSR